MMSLTNDLRFGLRALLRRPGFATIAVLTLALGIGATAATVRGMVVRQGVVLAAFGIAIGLAVAGVVSSVMQSLLYGVRAVDPLTYGAVALALVGVAALASWLPAERAARVHLAEALRVE